MNVIEERKQHLSKQDLSITEAIDAMKGLVCRYELERAYTILSEFVHIFGKDAIVAAANEIDEHNKEFAKVFQDWQLEMDGSSTWDYPHKETWRFEQ